MQRRARRLEPERDRGLFDQPEGPEEPEPDAPPAAPAAIPARSEPASRPAEPPAPAPPPSAERAPPSAERAPPPLYTVAQLSALVHGRLQELGRVRVEGEVSQKKRTAAGHLYFDLKDPGAKLACKIWQSQVARV